MIRAHTTALGVTHDTFRRAAEASLRHPAATAPFATVPPATTPLPVSARTFAAAFALTLACWGCSALLSSVMPAMAAVLAAAAQA